MHFRSADRDVITPLFSAFMHTKYDIVIRYRKQKKSSLVLQSYDNCIDPLFSWQRHLPLFNGTTFGSEHGHHVLRTSLALVGEDH